jgi:hypothetical protein
MDVKDDAEVFETVTTEDLVVDLPDGSWATLIVRPAGEGWEVLDAHRKRHTVWRRSIKATVSRDRVASEAA